MWEENEESFQGWNVAVLPKDIVKLVEKWLLERSHMKFWVRFRIAAVTGQILEVWETFVSIKSRYLRFLKLGKSILNKLPVNRSGQMMVFERIADEEVFMLG